MKRDKKSREPFPPDHTPTPPDHSPNPKNMEKDLQEARNQRDLAGEPSSKQDKSKKTEAPKPKRLGESETEIDDETTI